MTVPLYNLTDLWNSSSTVYTAIKMNATDTASNNESMLLDLQVSGVSKFFIGKHGEINRTRLTADTNYYVATTGNDANDGSIGSPWLTLQHADNVISQNIDLAGFDAIINIAAGSYAGVENYKGYYTSVNFGILNIAQVKYVGDNTTPSNVVITNSITAQGVGFGQFAANIGNLTVVWAGVRFETDNSCLWADNYFVGTPAFGTIETAGKIEIGEGPLFVSIFSGNVKVSASCDILIDGGAWSGGTFTTAFMDGGAESAPGHIIFMDGDVTITGTPSIDFLFDFQAAAHMRLTGTVTGAYTGGPMRMFDNTFVFSFRDFTDLGTPSAKAVMVTGAVFIKFGSDTLQAIGGQIIGGQTNYSAPATGFSMTLSDFDGMVILEPAGTIATGTITMPVNVLDGARINIRSTQVITALTFAPSGGQTLMAAPTTIAAGGVIDVIYKASNDTWYF